MSVSLFKDAQNRKFITLLICQNLNNLCVFGIKDNKIRKGKEEINFGLVNISVLFVI